MSKKPIILVLYYHELSGLTFASSSSHPPTTSLNSWDITAILEMQRPPSWLRMW
jgi:hypothetical protein